MEIVEQKTDGILVIELVGRLDTASYQTVEPRFMEILEKEKNILIDCARLDYICSFGLRLVLKMSKAIRVKEGLLVICSPREFVKEVFEVSGYNRIMPILPTREEGTKLFESHLKSAAT